MRYFKYGNSGGIQKVIQREINENSGYFDSLKDLLESEKREWNNNLKIIHYCYDFRLEKEVYMVVADFRNYEEQFSCYFIEEESK